MVKLYTFCIIFISTFAYFNSDKAYGKFRVILKRFEFCKGPKSKDCTSGVSNIDNETNAAVDIVVKENIIPDKAKVMVSSTGSPDTMRLSLNKPCDSLFLKPLLKVLFNVNNKCVISKGDYHFSLNFQDMMETYYGGKYFYGAWHFKSMFYSNDCNFVCTDIEIQFVPRSDK